MTARDLRFLRSRYYEPSETLMLHYSVTVAETEASPNGEVDSWAWVPVGEAMRLVRPGGLAENCCVISMMPDLEKAGKEAESASAYLPLFVFQTFR